MKLAYIDPGTGSVILQAIIGLVVGGVYVVRKQIGALIYGLKKLFKRRKDQD